MQDHLERAEVGERGFDPMVVLDARTGKLRWYNQLVPNDSHDWDLTQASPLIDTTINGAARRLVVTAGKDGFLRPIDRTTHQIVYATPVATIENASAPVTTKPGRTCPGVLGGVQWSGPAYHPGTNMLYVPAVDWCSTFVAFEEPRYIPGKNYMGGSATRDPASASQGWVTAIDASTGAVKWKYRSPRPMVAAVTTTAGNLLLTGELGGDFLAFDARTGREVYRFNTGGSIGGGVVTYSAQGRQYIAVVSGSRPLIGWTRIRARQRSWSLHCRASSPDVASAPWRYRGHQGGRPERRSHSSSSALRRVSEHLGGAFASKTTCRASQSTYAATRMRR